MSTIFRCERCKRTYEPDQMGCGDALRIGKRNVTENNVYHSQDSETVDLCPDCLKSLLEFLHMNV